MSRPQDHRDAPVSLLAGLLGGRLGAGWHRDVDDVLLGTRPGAVDRTATTEVTR